MVDLSGRRIGQYDILELIGRGGMANVYRAMQTSIGREVAVKVLPAHFLQDPTFLERFNREVRVISKLEHPRILPVYDFGEQDGTPYIVMRYLPGGSLADRIRGTPGGLPLGEVSRLVTQIAEGLSYAHVRGIVHRDFKPSNVLLDEDGNAYLADFGIAKVAEVTAELTGSGIVGTPGYIAPEMSQAKGVSPLVDIYALGVTLFEMVTGRQPYEAETPMGLLMAHMSNPIPDARVYRADLPDAVQDVITRAMAKDPAERYQSANEMAAALSTAVTGWRPEPAVTTGPRPEPDDAGTIGLAEPEEEPLRPVDVAVQAPPEEVMPSAPEVAGPPRRKRGGRPLLWVGLGVALLVCVLAGALILSGVLGGMGIYLFGTATEEAMVPVEVAPEATPTKEPVVPSGPPAESPTPKPPPITLPPPTAMPGVPGEPVTRNDDWKPTIREFDGVEMALVPPGCFMMGRPDMHADQRPVHEQCFSEPFWIDVFEVTNAQYGSSGYHSGDKRPREQVDWFEAARHCELRGARLLTEAEWEYAARGPDGLVYPWGNDFVPGLVVYYDTPSKSTVDVDSLPGGVSWVGAFHMSGNVMEWVSSLYAPYPYSATDGRENPTDRTGERVLRGGAWNSREVNVHTAARVHKDPSMGDYTFGFRCARSE